MIPKRLTIPTTKTTAANRTTTGAAIRPMPTTTTQAATAARTKTPTAAPPPTRRQRERPPRAPQRGVVWPSPATAPSSASGSSLSRARASWPQAWPSTTVASRSARSSCRHTARPRPMPSPQQERGHFYAATPREALSRSSDGESHGRALSPAGAVYPAHPRPHTGGFECKMIPRSPLQSHRKSPWNRPCQAVRRER